MQPQKTQKRRALLLKRKALTTSFFDSSKIKSDGRKGSTSNASIGAIFGQPLEKCLSNDNAFGATTKQKGNDDSGGSGGSGHKLSRKSRLSITSLDNQLPSSSAISSDGNYVSAFSNFMILNYHYAKFSSLNHKTKHRADHATVYFQNMIHDSWHQTVAIV